MKKITQDQLKTFLVSIGSQYDVRVPIAYPDGTRILGRLDEGALALNGGKVSQKPTSVFFPPFERVLTLKNGKAEVQKPVNKPLFVIGFTAEDLACLEFIDKFFSTNYKDNIYFNKRENAVLGGISGFCGADGEFLKIAGGKCDFELIGDNGDFILCAYTAAGKKIEKQCPGTTTAASLDTLQQQSDALPTEKKQTLDKASALIRSGKVPAEFWDEIADRCIACTGCNLVCPTCTCFETIDWSHADGSVERHRIWDSCQLDGFQRETSGHNPMGTEGKRTCRRIHHKLAADVESWGYVTCMLCGRCDDACPTNIGIQAVSREIVSKYS